MKKHNHPFHVPCALRTERVKPEILEQHRFEQCKRNDYDCQHCGKPRAFHADDGFVPGNPPPIPYDVVSTGEDLD